MRNRIQKKSARNKESGFSILEILVVLTVISLVSAVSFSHFSATQTKPDIIRTLRSMSAIVHQIRNKSIETGLPRTLTINTKTKTVSVKDGIQNLEFDRTITIEVQTAAELIAGDISTIIFNPDGSSTGGFVRLSDLAKNEGQLTINWLTGIPTVTLESHRK